MPNFAKFPVNFPVTRNFNSGDEFATDCVHRHLKNRALISNGYLAGQIYKPVTEVCKWIFLFGLMGFTKIFCRQRERSCRQARQISDHLHDNP